MRAIDHVSSQSTQALRLTSAFGTVTATSLRSIVVASSVTCWSSR